MTIEARDKQIVTSSSSRINIVLFCGGRGSATIINELLRWPTINLTLIVNAYDDGLSTGALRGCISQMLGPSDFRKNLSYLLDPYSKEQYALKKLLEFRLPQSINELDIIHLIEGMKTKNHSILNEPMRALFEQIDPAISLRIRHFLQTFFTYVHDADLKLDYRDCSIGNLIFSGVYLEKNKDFNSATKEMAQLVSSRALLVNVCKGENRILVGLKDDGELLATEAHIVGTQSSVPIRSLFLLDKPVLPCEWQALIGQSIDKKESWLREKETLPDVSFEAEQALLEADIILFGPGTQHSSLLPSYRIMQKKIKLSSAPIKIFIMNLGIDNDIQSLSASDIVDTALSYMDDSHNINNVITHILLDKTDAMNKDKLLQSSHYKNCLIIHDEFANRFKENIHSGSAVVKSILQIWKQNVTETLRSTHTLSIFIDIHKRSLALTELYEEMLEIDWKVHFAKVDLTVNKTQIDMLTRTDFIKINTDNRVGAFPEVDYFLSWLRMDRSEYLVMLTGDGMYCFRDVMLGIKLLEQSHFGAVFGSRNQSRLQFQESLRAAYGENKILSTLSFLGSFLISTIFALRFGILFSDPLTGFRIFKRSKMTFLADNIALENISTSINLATYLIKNNIEIAELPVNYRTFTGFVDPYWRVRRGFKNLISTFKRHPK